MIKENHFYEGLARVLKCFEPPLGPTIATKNPSKIY